MLASFAMDQFETQARRAVALVLVSAFLNSFGGLILRSVEQATEWQIVFFRAVSLSLALSVLIYWRRSAPGDRKPRRAGFWELVCGILFCNMQTLFIISLSNTTVANTTFTLSAAPIVTVFLARLALGEATSRGTWIVLLIGLLGVSLMVTDGLATGNILGDLAALGAMLSFVGFVVTLRIRRDVDMMPSLLIGGVLASLVSFGAVRGALGVPLHDLMLCLFWGGILSSVVLACFTVEARHLKGGVLTVLGLLATAKLPRVKPDPFYDKRFSAEQFGLAVRCRDRDVSELDALMRGHGAVEVELVER